MAQQNDANDVEGSETCNREGCDNHVTIQKAVGKPDHYPEVCSECKTLPSGGAYNKGTW